MQEHDHSIPEPVDPKVLGDEFFTVQEKLNEGRGIQSARDIADQLRRGDLVGARATCVGESDKLGSYPDVKDYIVQKLFAGEKKHPWSLFENNEFDSTLADIREQILDGDDIYSPQLLESIRNYYNDKSVVVLDVDGVLRGDASEDEVKLNELAEQTIQDIKDAGYPIVIWTAGTKNGVRGLNNQGVPTDIPSIEHLLPYADLVISRENYSRDEDTDGLIQKAVDSAVWLPSESTKTKGKSEISLSVNRKHPELLFNRVCHLEDGGSWSNFFPEGDEYTGKTRLLRGYLSDKGCFSHIVITSEEKVEYYTKGIEQSMEDGDEVGAAEARMALEFQFKPSIIEYIDQAFSR